MEVKKSKDADLESSKISSYLMGLIVGLAVLFVGFEWGTQDIKEVVDTGITEILAEEEIEITRPEDTPPPPPPPPVQVTPEILEVVEDNVKIEEREIISTEDDSKKAQEQVYVPTAPVAAQDEEESAQEIFAIVEEMPSYPGGETEMMKFLRENLRYPVIAQENGVTGRVTVGFVVNRDGSIVDVAVLRGVDPSLDKEALRVVGIMPKWTPGKQRGKPVRVKFTVPVTFKLN
ncbi:MAG: TonB family protein [Tannerellaceae bacterium]|jgi:protein TonB|nr:TonB family protein [Tannerellaceae bacterium]